MADLVSKVRASPPLEIGPDEEILAVAMLMKRGSVLRSSPTAAVGGLVQVLASEAILGTMSKRARAAEAEVTGDAATWPAAQRAAMIVTARRLLIYDPAKGLGKLGAPLGVYPIERIAAFSYEKKMLNDVIRIAFVDGSVIAFDAGKGQRLDELVGSLRRT